MTPLWGTLALVALLVVPTEGGAQLTGRPPPVVLPQSPERPVLDRLLARGEIQVAEGNLQDFGFDPGPVDGIFTAQTRAAVRAFQARYGFLVTGLLDRETRRELLPGLDYWEFDP